MSELDQDVSPLSENAVHVYKPESSRCKSGKENRIEYKIAKNQWLLLSADKATTEEKIQIRELFEKNSEEKRVP